MPVGVYIRTEEIREKFRKASLGKHHTEKWKKDMSEAQKGEKNGMYGKHHSPETIEKMSGKNHPMYGIPSPNLGKHFSEEHRRNIGKSLKGLLVGEKNGMYRTHLSEETIKKMSEANKGENNPNYGKNHSEETIKKIREYRAKQILPTKDTKIEIKMQNAFKKENIIFEKHKPIIGQPDIFIEPNICIFCDGDFWHANPSIYKEDKTMLKNKTAKDIWEKDKRINETLENQRFKVFRFWEHQINNNINACIEEVNSYLLKK